MGFSCWWRQHFEFQPACVAVDGRTRSNAVQNTCARLQISLFAQFKTRPKSHESYVFLYPFSNMTISPPPPPQKKKKKKKRSILYQSVNSMGCQVCTKAESVKVCVCVLLGGRGVLLQLRPSKCPVPSCITISLSVYHPDSCFLCQAVSVYQCITQTTVLSVSVCYHYISV